MTEIIRHHWLGSSDQPRYFKQPAVQAAGCFYFIIQNIFCPNS